MNADTSRVDRTWLWLTLVILLSVGVFTPALISGFTYDDPHYAKVRTPAGDKNPMVAELQPFADYWGKPMNWGLPNNCRGFRPTTVYSYALINQAFADPDGKGEEAAFPNHVLNLLLHGLATLLVFFLVRPLVRTATPALLAATVFGVHALHSDPVASIVGRGELLGFVFGAGALLLYSLAMRCQTRWRLIGSAAVGTILLLAMGGKESAIAWAVLIPIYAQLTDPARASIRQQLVPAAIGLLLPLVVFVSLRQAMLSTHVIPRGEFFVEYDANPLYYLPWLDRVVTACSVLVAGLGKVLLPTHLSSNYGDGPFTILHGILEWRFLLSSLLLVAVLCVGLRSRRERPLLFLAVAVFFGFTFITSNIPFPIETIFGDRLFYTPVLALAFAVAFGWTRIVGSERARSLAPAAVTIAIAWVGLSATISIERSLAWYNNTTLTTADLRSQPDSVGLHIDMGNLHLANFDQPGGKREFREALRINPQSARAMRFVAEHAEPAEARELLARALRSPLLVEGTEGRRIHWALGQLHEKDGDAAAARREIELALACNPFVPDIRLHLLHEALSENEIDRFEELLTEGRRLDPSNPYFEMNRGLLLDRRGKHAAAATVLRAILPGLPEQKHVVDAWLTYAECLIRDRPHRDADLVEVRRIAQRYLRKAKSFPDLRESCEQLLAAAGPPR